MFNLIAQSTDKTPSTFKIEDYTPARTVTEDVPSGTTTVYTCPTGKKALIVSASIYVNLTSVSVTTCQWQHSVRGTIYRMAAVSGAVAAGNINSPAVPWAILEAGDVVQTVITATGTLKATTTVSVIEFDAAYPASTIVKQIYGGPYDPVIVDVSRSWYAAAATNTGQYMLASSSTAMYKSLDYGATWTAISTSTIPLTHNCIAMGTGAWYVFYDASSVKISTDNGSNWTVKNSGSGLITVAACSWSGQYCYSILTTAGGLQTSDYGANWSAIAGIPTGMGLIACSADGSRIVATKTSGYKPYISMDYGATWAEMSGATTASCNSLAMSPNGSQIVFSLSGSSVAQVATYNGSSWSWQSVGIQIYSGTAKYVSNDTLLFASNGQYPHYCQDMSTDPLVNPVLLATAPTTTGYNNQAFACAITNDSSITVPTHFLGTTSGQVAQGLVKYNAANNVADNWLIYTCPAGKKTTLLNAPTLLNNLSNTSQAMLISETASSTAMTGYLYYVPNGTTNLYKYYRYPSMTATNISKVAITLANVPILNAGDAIHCRATNGTMTWTVAGSGAGTSSPQYIMLNVLEEDA